MLLIAALLAAGEVRAQQTAMPLPAAAAPAAQAPDGKATTGAPETAQAAPTDGASGSKTLRHAKGDPLEKLNRSLFAFHQRADKALFRPVAMFYKTVIPKLLRTALRHIISNLTEPLVFMNDVLQLKPKRAAQTFSRFVLNSTVGIGGIADVAKANGLPHHDNSLGDTLARYGVGPGPYLFIPFFGPTDLRDLLGGQVENSIYPVAIGMPFDRIDYQLSSGLVAGIDLRAESDADFKALLEGAADPYATLRSVYLQSRAAEIAEIKGVQPASGLDDPLTDPEPPANAPSTEKPKGDSASIAPDPADAPATGDSAAAAPAASPLPQLSTAAGSRGKRMRSDGLQDLLAHALADAG